jgi:CBS domain-containing protein
MRAMADGAKVRTVGDVMTTDVHTATRSDLLAEVCGRMLKRRVGSAIVVDEAGRAVGIVTERDLVRAAAAGADPEAARVSEWMTPDPDTITPSEEVYSAFVSLGKHGYRHFPVVENGRLVGVVSLF